MAGAKRAAKTKSTAPRTRLFWCSTPDHDEDWFVVARSAAGARRYHEDAEGYARGDATAELVCALPARFARTAVGWPSDALLDACGAERLKRSGARVVRIGDRLFGEGDIAANAAARMRLITRQ